MMSEKDWERWSLFQMIIWGPTIRDQNEKSNFEIDDHNFVSWFWLLVDELARRRRSSWSLELELSFESIIIVGSGWLVDGFVTFVSTNGRSSSGPRKFKLSFRILHGKSKRNTWIECSVHLLFLYLFLIAEPRDVDFSFGDFSSCPLYSFSLFLDIDFQRKVLPTSSEKLISLVCTVFYEKYRIWFYQTF